MNVSCVNELMTVCVHKENVNLSAVRTSLNAGVECHRDGAVQKQTTSGGGFCYVIDMSKCRSNKTARHDHINTVCTYLYIPVHHTAPGDCFTSSTNTNTNGNL